MTVVGLLLVLQISAAPPDTATGDPVRETVIQWILQLEAPSLAERSRAERELLDLGPKILPLLPPRDLLSGSASRAAVQRLRIQLQRQLASDSVRPSRVSLSGEFTLTELLTEIAKQSSNPLRLSDSAAPLANDRRRWELEHVTFWEAVDTICRNSGTSSLIPIMFPESDAVWLTLLAQPTARPVVIHAGVLRVSIVEAKRQSIVGDPNHRLLRVRGELMFEPRLRPLFVHFKAGDFSARPEESAVLPAWNPSARYELPMAGASRRTQVTWDFRTPAEIDWSCFQLDGKLLVQLAAATELIDFELPAGQEVLRRRGGVSVRLFPTELSPNAAGGRDGTVKISVSYETGGPAFESHRTWVYHNAAWIEHGEKRIPFTDFETLQQVDGGVELEYRFQNLPADGSLRFVYEAPTLLLDVPFEVKLEEVRVDADR